MKKAFLLFCLISTTILAAAQTAEIEKLKSELKSHPQQDTFRVNRLNALANRNLPLPDREKYANEALSISKKINYVKGEGHADLNLCVIKFNQGKNEESRKWLMRADTIAKKTVDTKIQAEVFFFMAITTQNEREREMLFQKADSTAKKSDDLTFQFTFLTKVASALVSTGSEKTLPTYLEAEKIARKSGNVKSLVYAEANIGYYYEQGISNYAKALEYFFKELSIAEKANQENLLLNCWSDIGGLYASLGDHKNALQYFLKAEAVSGKIKDKKALVSLQNLIGENYRLSGKYAEAIKAYNKVIPHYKEAYGVDDYYDISNLADVYCRIDSLSLAFQFAFTSLNLAKRYNDKVVYAFVDCILSRAYLKKNMPDSAINYGEWGLAAAKQTGSIEMMRDNTLALSNAYAFKKDYKKAYDNRLLYIDYRDSMVNAEVRNKTAVQQYTYNLDKKQAQITSLSSQKKYQRNLLIGAVVLLFLILVTAGLLLRNNRQKQKANKLLEKQKQEIDEKARNVELLSDIGRKITSSLSVENIISTVYANVNTMMDANIFGIGIYNEATRKIDFPATFENGAPLPFYANSIDNENRFGAVCFKSGQEIIINNLDKEYKNYIQEVSSPHEGDQPASIIFLPLMAKGEKLGVITVQSFKENAYSDYQLFMLRNIATYAAIAIQNAESYEALNKTLSTLKSTQSQLIQSEKMASLGELTAGIAHEIQNPLNFVNNFSEINKELIDEMNEEIENGNLQEVKVLSKYISENQEKILHHGKRADAIVKGMLQHSRSSSGRKELTDINALADEYLRLSYHGLRAKDKSFNSDFKTELDSSIGKINVVPQDIGRVLLNLFNNAFYAVKEKKRHDLNGYAPSVLLTTKSVDQSVVIMVKDNANGIPREALGKIFQPFFTTKPTGEGTGLGLSLSYDIIKTHGGEIRVETEEGKGTTFIIELPVSVKIEDGEALQENQLNVK